MSDETIRKGDLCVVILPMPCCGNTDSLGMTFTANSGEEVRDLYYGCCGGDGVHTVVQVDADSCFPRSILKKIRPLAKPATVQSDEEITA